MVTEGEEAESDGKRLWRRKETGGGELVYG